MDGLVGKSRGAGGRATESNVEGFPGVGLRAA